MFGITAKSLTSDNIKISVITPVYNAAHYVRTAVESALAQPETAEVSLIEDGSSDNSLEECEKIDAEFEKVHLFTHQRNANLGAGPSRNVGIAHAQCEYIAFLDADDYFLPNRFRVERQILPNDPNVDGVYGAVGSHYYSEQGKLKYDAHGYAEMITVPIRIGPEDLFETLMGLNRIYGYFHLDALTVRKRIFALTGLFSDLRLHQDTEMILKMACLGRLVAGEINSAIATVGIHDSHRIVANPKTSNSQETLYLRLYEWAAQSRLPRNFQQAFLNHYHLSRIRRSGRSSAILELMKLAINQPTFFRNRAHYGMALDHISGGSVLGLFLLLSGSKKRKKIEGKCLT